MVVALLAVGVFAYSGGSVCDKNGKNCRPTHKFRIVNDSTIEGRVWNYYGNRTTLKVCRFTIDPNRNNMLPARMADYYMHYEILNESAQKEMWDSIHVLLKIVCTESVERK